VTKHRVEDLISKATGATEIIKSEVIQKLWSGYGEIVRYNLCSADRNSIIVKHIQLARQGQHPRGWNNDLSHNRKLKSYEIETNWYKKWAISCDESSRIPHCLAIEADSDETIIILEDLDASGYPGRKNSVSMAEMKVCISWLANFHATFLGKNPDGLWPIGSYWHLDTRPDELQALTDIELKNAADKIDRQLKNSPYQTIIHGDAKLANFCFSSDGKKVAVVDFQYCGGGCGVKDLAYFIGSCLYEQECERLESKLLDFYFRELTTALQSKNSTIDVQAVEDDWRALYPFAWTDFHRFIKGWSPGHWKIHSYSERVAREVLEQLNTGSLL